MVSKLKELPTVNIDGVEILAVGKWDGTPTTMEYKTEDLDAIVKSFEELSGDKELNYEPPVKLGHDDNQKLLQEDGYPAAGWVSSLKRVGEKLVADFKGVPRKIGDIIKAGGWKKVSSEIYTDYEEGGKKFPMVLKAVSLLGGDIPAVKTIADIQAQYDESGKEYVTVLYAEPAKEVVTLDEIMLDLDAWLAKSEGTIKGKVGSPAIRTYLKEVKAKLKALVARESKLEEADMAETKKEDGIDFPAAAYAYVPDSEKPSTWKIRLWEDLEKKETAAQVGRALAAFSPGGFRGQKVSIPDEDVGGVKAKVRAAWKRVNPDRDVSEMPDYIKSSEKEEVMENELRELLGLSEDADVLEAIGALKTRAEKSTTQLAESEKLGERVKTLETTLAERDRDDAVKAAMEAGKLSPAQKEWADDYALRDPSGFVKFIEKAPKVVELGEKGGGGEPTIELTEAEIAIGKKMGVSEEELIKSKKEVK